MARLGRRAQNKKVKVEQPTEAEVKTEEVINEEIIEEVNNKENEVNNKENGVNDTIVVEKTNKPQSLANFLF